MTNLRRTTTRAISGWALVAFAGFCAISPCARAATITSAFLLQALNQNIWDSGSAATFEYHDNLTTEWDASGTAGSIGSACLLGACGRDGAQATASTSGAAAISFELAATAGTADVSVAGNSSFVVPDNLQAGKNFKITASSQVGPTAYTTRFANVSMRSSLDFEAQASVSEEVCVVGACTSDSSGDLIGVNTTASLLSYNLNNDDSLKVLGYTIPIINFGKVVSLPLSGPKVGDFMLNSPNIETTGVLNSAGTQLTSSGGNDNVLQIQADALNDLTNMPFSGTYDHLKVDLLEGNLGLAAGITQSYTLNLPTDQDIRMKLLVEETGQEVAVNGSGLSQNIMFPVGYQYLTIVPVYDLDLDLQAETDVTLDPTLNINGLEVGILGEDLGPVLNKSLQFKGASISAQSTDASVQFESVEGTPFVVSLADPDAPEPGTWMLLLAGMAAIGARRWLRVSQAR